MELNIAFLYPCLARVLVGGRNGAIGIVYQFKNCDSSLYVSLREDLEPYAVTVTWTSQ